MRDRLIELTKSAFAECKGKKCEDCVGYGKGADCIHDVVVDHLIANGVVIIDPQKYPPVTNRGIIETIMGVPLDEMAALIADKEKGYRKQSEWISVDEALPEKDDIYLVCLNGLPADFDRFVVIDGEGYFEHSKVTHWLPIPEAPKMKGGAE